MLTLAAAFIAQYVFLLAPCHLCILQRWPYAGVILIGLLGPELTKNTKHLRLLLLLCIALFLVGGGIAFYHAGVENGLFPGPSSCTSTSTGNETIEELRAQIMGAPLVSCDQPLGHLLGLSLAVWSTLIYLFLTILASYGYSRVRRHDDFQ